MLVEEEPEDETNDIREQFLSQETERTKQELERVNRTGKELLDLDNDEKKLNFKDKIKITKNAIKTALIDNSKYYYMLTTYYYSIRII